MKYMIVIFIILLSFVGFTLFAFIQDEVDEFQGTNEFKFNNSKPITLLTSENKDYVHRISYHNKNKSLLESVKESDSRYLSLYYFSDDKLVCEEVWYEDSLEIKPINKVSGDLLISMPIYDEMNWNISSTNVNHDQIQTFKTTGFNIYVVTSKSSGYNKFVFSAADQRLKLEYALK